MKILVFGNPLVEKDNLTLKILLRLRESFPKIEFKEFDPSESLEKEGRNLLILDVCEGINHVTILDNPDILETFKVRSMHDFDLSYNLKLLKKMKMIDSVKIIGIPMWMAEDDAFEEVSNIIPKING